MDNVGFNPNPAFVGYTKQAPPPTITVWNDPTIPRIGNMITMKNAANPNGVLTSFGGSNIYIQAQPDMTSSEQVNDATFVVFPANNGKDGYISFQSYNYVKSYIRHSNFIAYLNENDGTSTFNNDTSFVVVPALNNDPSMFSLQSFNYPDHYLMTATNPNGSIQVVLRVPGSATANASWTGVLPLVAQ